MFRVIRDAVIAIFVDVAVRALFPSLVPLLRYAWFLILIWLTFDLLNSKYIKKHALAAYKRFGVANKMTIHLLLFILGGSLLCFYWWGTGRTFASAKPIANNADLENPASVAIKSDPDRAWISAVIEPLSVNFDARGAQVFFDVHLNNVGHTPATNVTVWAKVLNSQGPNISGEQKTLAPMADYPNNGETIFQTKESVTRFGLMVSPEEMDKSKTFQGWRETDLLLHVIVCADYVINKSREHHQSYAAVFIWSNSAGRSAIIRGTNVGQEQIRYTKTNQGIPDN